MNPRHSSHVGTPKVGSVYRHYKGGLYVVVTNNTRKESEGLTGEFFIVYKRVQASEPAETWARSERDFCSVVDTGHGTPIPRFELVHDGP